MAIRSDVAVVFTEKLNEFVINNASEELKEFLGHHDIKTDRDGQILYTFDSVKWYVGMEGYEPNELLKLIEDREDEFYIVEVCSETTSVESWGIMYENNFNIGYSMSIYFEV